MFATHCNKLQHTAAYCNTLHHTSNYTGGWNVAQRDSDWHFVTASSTCTATHCNTLQHCITMHHTTSHCNALQLHRKVKCSAARRRLALSDSQQHTYCHTLQHNATQCTILLHTATHCNYTGGWSVAQHDADWHFVTANGTRSKVWAQVSPQHTHTTTHCNALQVTATHYSTLQRTTTHCNTLHRKVKYGLRCLCFKFVASSWSPSHLFRTSAHVGHLFAYTRIGWLRLVASSKNYTSLLQNMISFIGLFFKRDLSF